MPRPLTLVRGVAALALGFGVSACALDPTLMGAVQTSIASPLPPAQAFPAGPAEGAARKPGGTVTRAAVLTEAEPNDRPFTAQPLGLDQAFEAVADGVDLVKVVPPRAGLLTVLLRGSGATRVAGEILDADEKVLDAGAAAEGDAIMTAGMRYQGAGHRAQARVEAGKTYYVRVTATGSGYALALEIPVDPVP